MKKIYIYMVMAVIAAAAAILAVSCVRELDFPLSGKCDQSAIRITPVVASPVTKADDEPKTEPGDDDYNENLISDYYWFIFADEAGTQLKLSGHETGKAAKEILLDNVFPNGGTGYVYVVANLPADEFTFADGGIKTVATGTFAKTLSQLQAISFGKNTPTSFPASTGETKLNSEFYEYTTATTGVPAPEKFVMRTPSPISFTLVEKTMVDVTAELKRVAAKIILDLNVMQEVRQTHINAAGQEEYTKTWIADMNHIQIYMLWGSTHGDLAGNKVSYSSQNESWFYSASPRYAMYANPDGGSYDKPSNTVTGSVPNTSFEAKEIPVSFSEWAVVYQIHEDTNGDPIWNWNSNVPEADRTEENKGNTSYGNWDYVQRWIWNDGIPVEQQTTENKGNTAYGHYSTTAGDYEPALNPDGTIQRKLITTTRNEDFYAISSKPLYSMPIEWSVNDAHAPFIKIILPWQGCIRADNGTGDIVSYDMKNGQRKTTEYYYKVLIPNRTTLDANGCYHISLDLAVLGSEADEVPVELSGKYHVVDWSASTPQGGDQNAGRYLDCAKNFEFYSQNEMNIPIRSSHDIEIVGTPTATYNNYSQTTVSTGNLTYSPSSSTGNNFTITPVGNSKVTVKHTQQTSLASMMASDVSPITYTFTIQHKGEGGSAYQKTITIIQYPSLYINSKTSTARSSYSYREREDTWSPWYYYNQGYVWINNAQSHNNPADWYYIVGMSVNSSNVIQQGTNQNPNTYVITTTVLDNSLNYVLGDPRVDVIDNLVTDNTFASATAKYGTSPRRLTYYYPTDRTSRTENMVAPAFRIASSYGKCGNSTSFDNMQKRCAAYQEEGFPAGRWRVPTKAELEYITTLSAKGLIPSLFNTIDNDENPPESRSRYFSAHGLLKVNLDGTVSENTTYETGWVRCVYDEWYWKDDTVNIGTFTWGDKQR